MEFGNSISRFMAAIIMPLLLTACGGGSGNNISGVTKDAITLEGEALAYERFKGSREPAILRDLAQTEALITAFWGIDLPDLPNIAHELVGVGSDNQRLPTNGTMAGKCENDGMFSGSFNLASDERPSQGDVVEVRFDNCQLYGGFVFNGKLSVRILSASGHPSNQNQNWHLDMAVGMAGFSIDSATQPDIARMGINGGYIARTSWNADNQRYSYHTQGDVLLIESGDDQVLAMDFESWYEDDYQQDIFRYSDNASVATNWSDGYLRFDTIRHLARTYGGPPVDGEVMVSGANGARMRVTIVDGLGYRGELDLNGDGTYEKEEIRPFRKTATALEGEQQARQLFTGSAEPATLNNFTQARSLIDAFTDIVFPDLPFFVPSFGNPYADNAPDAQITTSQFASRAVSLGSVLLPDMALQANGALPVDCENEDGTVEGKGNAVSKDMTSRNDFIDVVFKNCQVDANYILDGKLSLRILDASGEELDWTKDWQIKMSAGMSGLTVRQVKAPDTVILTMNGGYELTKDRSAGYLRYGHRLQGDVLLVETDGQQILFMDFDNRFERNEPEQREEYTYNLSVGSNESNGALRIDTTETMVRAVGSEQLSQGQFVVWGANGAKFRMTVNGGKEQLEQDLDGSGNYQPVPDASDSGT